VVQLAVLNGAASYTVALPDYQLSATEHVRAVVIPQYGAVSGLCVVYVNSALSVATMQCPKEDFLTVEPEQDSPK
jgi:hypothetical protein